MLWCPRRQRGRLKQVPNWIPARSIVPSSRSPHGVRSQYRIVYLADDLAPFNHRIRLIPPKAPGDGIDGRAIPLDWNHSIGQGIFLLTPGSGPASALGHALLWRHSGHINSLFGWSGSPLEHCDPGNYDKRAKIFGFQNFEFMNCSFSFQEVVTGQ